jgi:translocation and assembly module TamA
VSRGTAAYGLLILLGISAVWGADPQPYRVDIAATKDSALNEALKSTSELLTLRKGAPVGPFGLIGRARGDVERLKAVLESLGYYQGKVSVTIDALPLDDPALGEELTQRPRDQDAHVNIAFDLGPLYHLGTIDIVGEAPPTAAASVNLASGAPAVAADVLAAQTAVGAHRRSVSGNSDRGGSPRSARAGYFSRVSVHIDPAPIPMAVYR